MRTEDYERLVSLYDVEEQGDIYYALGLTSEAGEAGDMVKKAYRRGEWKKPIEGEREREFILELGDVLWYLTRLATRHGHTLEQIMDLNIDKLERRRLNSEEYRRAQAAKLIREHTA